MYRILSSVRYLPDTTMRTRKHKPLPKSLPKGSEIAYASRYEPHNLFYTRPEQILNQSVLKETIKTGNGRVVGDKMIPQAVEPQDMPKKVSYGPDLFDRMKGSLDEIPLPLRTGRSMGEDRAIKETLKLDESNEYLPV